MLEVHAPAEGVVEGAVVQQPPEPAEAEVPIALELLAGQADSLAYALRELVDAALGGVRELQSGKVEANFEKSTR